MEMERRAARAAEKSPVYALAGANSDKMVKVRVQRSKREYLARVLRHAKRNEESKMDWMHLAERTSRYFIYLHLIVLFVSSIVIMLTVKHQEKSIQLVSAY